MYKLDIITIDTYDLFRVTTEWENFHNSLRVKYEMEVHTVLDRELKIYNAKLIINLLGQYPSRYLEFETEEDATLFKLKWS